MTLTRFKLLAGLFGLAVGGLAALAEPPAVPAIPSISVPRTAVCHQAPVVTVQATLPTPVIESPPAVVPVAVAPEIQTPPAPKADLPPVTAPGFNFSTTQAVPPPLPEPSPSKPDLRLAPVPTAELPPPPGDTSSKPEKIADGSLGNLGIGRPRAESDALQVCLKLGDGKPKFEVMRGEDVLLKVVCNGVDAKAPSDKGEVFSVLRASGTVRFIAPGCEGTCEELVVHPVTGDVILTKGVEVTCKIGKGSTVMKADQMTFKLGMAPAFAVSDVSAITPTSGRR